jgi:hypothetical protein
VAGVSHLFVRNRNGTARSDLVGGGGGGGGGLGNEGETSAQDRARSGRCDALGLCTGMVNDRAGHAQYGSFSPRWYAYMAGGHARDATRMVGSAH